uniref:Triggering receptor expressed on myeloid cells 1 n=1 Tax=Molossus molossus TaxID=27622 RepID=A0A7J8GTL6_MOLMO|nr:triggering receptor expressed on myeloid cells 1 [Molossus molossus]
MRKTRLCGLLWMFLAELQAAVKLNEEKITLTVGQTLNVQCPFNVMYARSKKAWQRLTDEGERRTLAVIGGGSEPIDNGQRYFLEELPTDGIMYVRMTNLQLEDSGLYECVIHQPPKDPYVLFHPVRLTVTVGNDPASEKSPARNSAQVSTLPPITTKARRTLRNSSRTVTQHLPMPTASLSSPGLEVNPTQGTDVIRFSRMSIIIIVVCGILSKSLVFTALLFVTQRSCGP